MNLNQLRTPAFLVDRERFEANCRRALETARRLGVRLRPHVKTHKTVEGARLQVGASCGPVTVSTLAEAEYLADAGFDDITYAVPPEPGKLDDLERLARRVERLHLVVDQPELLAEMERRLERHGRRFSVFLKVDCGNHRVGVDPSRPGALSAARRVADSPAVEFQGLLTHAGQSYLLTGKEEKARMAAWEGQCLVGFAGLLRESGVACREVSVGSTPTLIHAPAELPGVTEMRPGNYVFFDQMQVDLGNCTLEQVAATVLASVIAVYPDQNRFVVDAGALALSKDPGFRVGKPTYGRLLDQPQLKVVGTSQEHGLVGGEEPIDFSRIRVGSRVRIVPNHSCLAAALFPQYFVTEGEQVIDRWIPVRGW